MEKKEIGMEKLVMLLDIYEEEVVGVHSVGEHITEKDEAWITSKKFGFIKWLVENDKIDLFSRNALFIYEDTENGEKQRPYSFYEEMLIRLSISDIPIEDLISYLK